METESMKVEVMQAELMEAFIIEEMANILMDIHADLLVDGVDII
jgi:hypothetical protein